MLDFPPASPTLSAVPSRSYVDASTQTPRWGLLFTGIPSRKTALFTELPGSKRKLGEVEIPETIQETVRPGSEPEPKEPPRKRAKPTDIGTSMFDADGNLALGPKNPPNPYAYRPVSYADKNPKRTELEGQENQYSYIETPDEGGQHVLGLSSEPREEPKAKQVPETPRAPGWGLTSLLPSAKTVSKFLPFSSRRTPSASIATQPRPAVTPDLQWQARTLDFDRPNPHPITFARQANLQSQLGPQTEPRQQNGGIDIEVDTSTRQANLQSQLGPQTEPRQQNGGIDIDVDTSTRQANLQSQLGPQTEPRQQNGGMDIDVDTSTRQANLQSQLGPQTEPRQQNGGMDIDVDTSTRQANLQSQLGPQTEPRQQNGGMDIDVDTSTRQANLQSQLGPQTEPRQQNGGMDIDFDTYYDTSSGLATEGPAKRRHEPRLLNYVRAKAETKEQRAFKKQQAELRAQQEKMAAEREMISKERERLYSERSKLEAQLEAAQVPGTKRKRLRLPSPDEIPNPSGGGFGMDLVYFGHSDSDSEEEEHDTPTKGRPAKRSRPSLPDNEIVGDPHEARPYTGTTFAVSGSRTAPDDNMFDDQPLAGHIASKAIITPSAPTTQPNSFRVPSPGDSDSDEEEDLGDGDTPTKAASSTTATAPPTSQTSTSSSTQSQTAPVAGPSSPSPSKPMAPPPRPNPSHTSLPSASSTAGRPFIDAVEKARQKALIHQPRTGSRLRESSRLSTSTVGSEADEDLSTLQPTDTNKSQDDFEYDPDIEGRHIPRYDPAHPGLQRLFMGAQHPSASLFGQHAAPATTQAGHVSAYDDYAKTMNSRVRDFVEQSWDDVHDTRAAIEEEEAEFAEYKRHQQQAGTSNSNSTTAPSVSTAIFPLGGTFANNFVTSDKVQQALNAGWTPADADATAQDLDIEYDAFTASLAGQSAALGAAA